MSIGLMPKKIAFEKKIANSNEVAADADAEMEVFFTEDKELLNQYYEMRCESYRDEWGFDKFDELETSFDRSGRIVVAVKSGKVVGGMRLMLSDECDFLSNEIPGTQYIYKSVVSKYDKRENLCVGEISALVVDKGGINSAMATELFKVTFDKCVEHGCDYVCGVSVLLVCRSERRILKRLNYDLEVIINFPWKRKKLYNYVNMFPGYVKLS